MITANITELLNSVCMDMSHKTGKPIFFVDQGGFGSRGYLTSMAIRIGRQTLFKEECMIADPRPSQLIFDKTREQLASLLLRNMLSYSIGNLMEPKKPVSNPIYLFNFCHPETGEVLLSAQGADVDEAISGLEKILKTTIEVSQFRVKAFVILNPNETTTKSLNSSSEHVREG